MRVRARRGGPGAHVQDVRGLQPRVRGAGVPRRGRLLRRARPPRVADRPGVRPRGVRRLAAASACILDRFVFRCLRGRVADRQAGLRRSVCSSRCRRSSRSGSARARPSGSSGIWWDDNALYHFGDYALDGRQMAILVSTAVVGRCCSVALFRWTAIGLQMRAVVESPRLTELAGRQRRPGQLGRVDALERDGRARRACCSRRSPRRSTSATSRRCSSPRSRRPRSPGSTSIPLALLGGILLGDRAGAARRLPAAGQRARPGPQAGAAVRRAVPAAAVLARAAQPAGGHRPARRRRPAAAVAGRRDAAARASPARRTSSASLFVAVVVLHRARAGPTTFWLSLLTLALVYSVIFLSITVITGMAGQISLCQATFAGIGAFTTAQLVQRARLERAARRWSSARCVAAAVGALLAIPVLRLGGIYLSLATLAFALMFENVLVPVGWIGGGRHAGPGAAAGDRPVRPLEQQVVLRLLPDRARAS